MTYENVSILLFKTDIKTLSIKVWALLNSFESVLRWSVDTEDSDCVLKVVAQGVSSTEVMDAVSAIGHRCEILD